MVANVDTGIDPSLFLRRGNVADSVGFLGPLPRTPTLSASVAGHKAPKHQVTNPPRPEVPDPRRHLVVVDSKTLHIWRAFAQSERSAMHSASAKMPLQGGACEGLTRTEVLAE